MKTTQPQIGTKTNFLRHEGSTLEVFEGIGIIRALFLQDNRLMAQVMDGEGNSYNVHGCTLGYDKSFIPVYEKALQEVRKVADEGAAVQMATVEQYNEIVKELIDQAFGAPLVLDTVGGVSDDF